MQVLHSTSSTVEDFYNIENPGIECIPRCGGCKCGKCSLGSKNYTIKEEKELALIEKNLHYDQEAIYPWIRDPKELPDNRKAAFAKLISTERRLAKNSEHAKVYKEQIQDMVNRGVARKLTKAELKNCKGPKHYISHHKVLKPDSKSTPDRIVFNSSAKYMGHVLNEYWAKGPDLLNNILAVLLRFRENEVAFIRDIKKMYHTVATNVLDQHTHRFLWREMETTREPDIYVIQRISFGDKPSGAIATVALRKTAEMGKDQFPEASQVILNNTYMDDIIESVNDREKAKQITDDIEKLLNKGGFKLKEWTYSEDRSIKYEPKIPMEPCTATEKVLGVVWDPIKDNFHFKVKLIIPSVLTKRIILSQVNSIYDSLGLAGPYTVRAKILMRKLWTYETKLDWDDPIPEEYGREWMTFFSDLPEMEKITVKRYIKPHRAIGDPILIIFSDGSNNAYGACAYVRWELPTREFVSYIILSKSRLAPVKRMSIDRIELCGAVLNKRLKTVLQKQCRYKFQRCYHIVDSQIVHAMIHKETYGFNTFAATRVGEIQESTEVSDWYWTESKNNIADWLTRGKRPIDIDINSNWQAGPDFLRLPENEWPISQTPTTVQKLPETIKASINIVNKTEEDTLVKRINIDNYSNFEKLLRVTARVLAMYHKLPRTTFKNVTKVLTPEDITNAEQFWILQAQKIMHEDLKKGKYKRLCPRKRNDGIYTVGGRSQRWMEMSYNKQELILLPYEHRFSKLYAEHIHQRGHLGVLSTASKIRSRFWIIRLLKLVKYIKNNCIVCRKMEKKLGEQIMGKLPIERLKPAPAWDSTALDFFGPFKVKDEVKKRTTGKAYGLIFNCLATRAIHVDVSPDYSTEKFLMVLRHFVSIRGYPSKLYSDNGAQLVAANKELKKVVKDLDSNRFNSLE